MTRNFDKYGDAVITPEQAPKGRNAKAKSGIGNYPTANYEPVEFTDKAPSTSNEADSLVKKGPDAEGDTSAQGKGETIEELLGELDQLIGLLRVKQEVHRLLAFVKVQALRQAYGISEPEVAHHSVFYGSPGTGKTTVARLYGRMLKSLGLLSKGHLVETDRAGLVGGYIGQTAIKTEEKISEALGGILFIDEAYSLSKGPHASWDYGSEVIQTLMKRMEDHRRDFVVIVAGYPDPMHVFLRSNEGFRSRFSSYIHFEDYSPEELLEIFKSFCEQGNYEAETEALELVSAAIDYKYSLRDATFGNARFIRNLFQNIIRNHAARVAAAIENPSESELKLITYEDVPLAIDEGPNQD